MYLIDTHCHLFSEQFDNDRTEAIKRAVENNIGRILLPNIDSESLPSMLKCVEDFPEYCLPMMGLHPCSVKGNFKEELLIVERELEKGIYIGVGEIGLDYYWDTTFKAEQQDAFRQQIQMSKDRKLPIAIHTRSSFEDAYNIVKEMKDNSLSGVFHCFSGTIEEAQKIIELGDFYMGIGGVLTFKNSGMKEVVEHIPLEYLILETDSPYLAPVPFRGKRNEPSYILNIAIHLAQIKGESIERITELTSANAQKLFVLTL